MDGFSTYIENYSSGLSLPGQAESEAVLGKYPWFITARIMLMQASDHKNDPVLGLHFMSHPMPVLRESRKEDAVFIEVSEPPTQQPDVSTEEDIINSFLLSGERRVIPKDDTPEEDAAYGSSILDLTDEMATEELAEIYLAQGLKEEAKEIYAKLSLRNPEKSVYFAEIVDGINRDN